MKNLMQYIITICMSFTFSTIFYLLFSLISIFPPFDERMIISMLFISIGITVFMLVTHLLPIQSLLLIRLLEILVIVFVLLAAGKVFNIYPLNHYYISFVLATGLLTYVVVVLVNYISDLMSASKINMTIQNRRLERFND